MRLYTTAQTRSMQFAYPGSRFCHFGKEVGPMADNSAATLSRHSLPKGLKAGRPPNTPLLFFTL